MEFTSFFVLAGSATLIGFFVVLMLFLLKNLFLGERKEKNDLKKTFESLNNDIEYLFSLKKEDYKFFGYHARTFEELKDALRDLRFAVQAYENKGRRYLLKYVKDFTKEALGFTEILKNNAIRYGRNQLAEKIGKLQKKLEKLREETMKKYNLNA